MLIRIVFLFCLLASSAWATEQPSHSVLFISSYHPGFPTFFDQVSGLNKSLKDHHIQLDIEFLDSKRFSSFEEHFQNNLIYKLSKLPAYDVVITGDDAATWFATQRKDSLFNGIPIVFFGVNDRDFGLSFNYVPQVTGVLETASFADTVALAETLFKNAPPITVVTDTTTTGQVDTQRFEQVMQQNHFDHYRYLSLADMTFDELMEKLALVKPPAGILLISCYRDRTGSSQPYSTTLARLRERTNAPIFHMWQHGIGAGILGGKVISHFQQATAAAGIALDILQGAPVADIKVIEDSPNTYLFDYNLMQKYGLNENDMPPDSQYINRPPAKNSFLQRVLWGALIFIAILALLVLSLLLRIRIKRQQELRMQKLNQELERKVEQRTQDLSRANQEAESLLRLRNSILDNTLVCIVLFKGEVIQWANQHTEALFGYGAEELIGQHSAILYNEYQDFRRTMIESPKILARGSTYEGEFAFKRKDGSTLWGMFSGKALNPHDLNEGILFIFIDISLRKDMEDQLKQMNETLEHLVITDHLTGIHNRRYANDKMVAELQRSQRYQQPFSLLLIDIDHFKKLNDQFGHDAGDAALIQVAQLLQRQCREVDTVARWGGEEFLVLCPETALNQAFKLADLLRQRIMELSDGLPCQVTASFGVTSYVEGQSMAAMLKAADKALYMAKEHRNCVKYEIPSGKANLAQ